MRGHIAVDCGHAVNPLTVAEQMEGGMIYGLSAALYGDISIKGGAVEQGNFDDYQDGAPGRRAARPTSTSRCRAAQMGRHAASPARAPIAAAVTNADLRPTGKRIRSLPIRPQDLARGA